MDQSILRLGSSMRYIERQMDVLSNNIANSNTSSFKKQEVIPKSFFDIMSDQTMKLYSKGLIDPSNELMIYQPGLFVQDVITVFEQGALEETSNQLDFAVNGSGFFAVDDSGTEKYIRGGHFKLNDVGYLVNSYGQNIKSKLGNYIYLENSNFTVDQGGDIYVDGNYVNSLKVVEFMDANALQRDERGTYQSLTNNNIIDSDAAVMQGFIEKSNVNIIEEMTKMMKISRLFETNQKTIQIIDSINARAASEIGRVY